MKARTILNALLEANQSEALYRELFIDAKSNADCNYFLEKYLRCVRQAILFRNWLEQYLDNAERGSMVEK